MVGKVENRAHSEIVGIGLPCFQTLVDTSCVDLNKEVSSTMQERDADM